MHALAWIGENRIAEAVREGEFDQLPGAGQPLDLTVRDAALDAESRLALELLERAQRGKGDAQAVRRERAAMRLLWVKVVVRRRGYAVAAPRPTGGVSAPAEEGA